MKIITIIFAVLCVPAISAPIRRYIPAKPAAFGNPYANPENKDAQDQLWACARTITDDNDQRTKMATSCSNTFHGVVWAITDDWHGRIESPTGIWTVFCKHETVERDNLCYFQTPQYFSIIRGNGYSIIVGVAKEHLPGAEQATRIDDRPLITTMAESYTQAQSVEIYKGMMTGKRLLHRWRNWPDGVPQDIDIDLNDFRYKAALFEAIRSTFAIEQDMVEVHRRMDAAKQ